MTVKKILVLDFGELVILLKNGKLIEGLYGLSNVVIKVELQNKPMEVHKVCFHCLEIRKKFLYLVSNCVMWENNHIVINWVLIGIVGVICLRLFIKSLWHVNFLSVYLLYKWSCQEWTVSCQFHPVVSYLNIFIFRLVSLVIIAVLEAFVDFLWMIYVYCGGLDLLHWFSKTNAPKRVAPKGYILKHYIVLQSGYHQILLGQVTY